VVALFGSGLRMKRFGEYITIAGGWVKVP